MDSILPIIYLFAALGFILAIKWMNHPSTARRGVIIGEIGMLLAVIGTLLRAEVHLDWILAGLAIGSAIGAPLAYLMPMTAVPQLTALSHAFGALASALIGTAEYYKETPPRFHHGRAGGGDVAGIPDHHGEHHRVREIAGDSAHPSAHL